MFVFWIVVASILATILALNFIPGEKKVQTRISELYAVQEPQFLRTMSHLLGPPLVAGNHVQELINGDEIFPPMLAAIRAAQKTITFETYIYWSGDIGREFAEALAERAQAGVKVHVLVDWVGSVKMDEELLKLMEDAGVELHKYHPLHWYHLARMNNRTHRKLLVIDGTVGFTGGVGIADNWLGDAQDADHWRDSHFRIEGPAVAHMQAAFLDNWMKTSGEVLHGEDYFPPLQPVGEHHAQVFKSSSGEGSESVRLMYLLSIASARKTIYIANAYFVPDDLSVETLVRALKRGVKVKIILPGKRIDSEPVRRASRARWGDLLEAGAEIYEYQPTMFHCKVMVVDDVWVSVGSTNFDSRSFRLNDEANLNIYDHAFAQRQIDIIEGDLKKSRQITYAEWRNRPWSEKLLEHTMALLRSQM
ncbi:MAG: cardiolipin synthase [Thiobacillus sp.]|uniref:cardiolipin synthase n=1 Tax=Thiobacillus sp. TaxID=924 RepID=UPI00273473FE|nr:cardiolipin synthase [Thiobacillus sp.]MDP3584268.1 cardiolipin synthase [Thiobacillus sp.]